MKLKHFEQIEQKDVEMEGASGCKMRLLVDANDGANNFTMRQFEVAVGGFTPKHSHPYEHEVFVLEGRGTVLEGDVEHAIKRGDVLFVRPDEVHQFKNDGTEPLKFLCLIPNSAKDKPVTLAPECGC